MSEISPRKVHHLKTIEPYYTALQRREKTFEVRRMDRDFKVGDMLVLQQYSRKTSTYTGLELHCLITYILTSEKYCKEGYCVMGLAFSNGNDKYNECINEHDNLVTIAEKAEAEVSKIKKLLLKPRNEYCNVAMNKSCEYCEIQQICAFIGDRTSEVGKDGGEG